MLVTDFNELPNIYIAKDKNEYFNLFTGAKRNLLLKSNRNYKVNNEITIMLNNDDEDNYMSISSEFYDRYAKELPMQFNLLITNIETLEDESNNTFYVIQLSFLESDTDRLLRIIFNFVCKKAKVDKLTMCSKTRKREVVLARATYCCLAFQSTYASLSTIGHLIIKDHATVLHNIDRIRKKKDLMFIKEFQNFCKKHEVENVDWFRIIRNLY